MTKPNFTRRDFLKLGAASLAAGILGAYAPTIFAENQRKNAPFQVIRHGSREQAKIALTFDDCYLVKKLQALEELLRENPEVKVTFFPTGEALLQTNQKDEGIWQRFLEGGHEIGSHTFDHGDPGIRSTPNLLEDYAKWLAALYQVTESKPPVRFARPPFGSLSPSYKEMCTTRGLIATMWTANWGGEFALAQKNIEAAERGDIALLHTRLEEIEENTPFAISILKKRSIQAVTMSELYFSSVNESIGIENCDTTSYYGQSCPD